MTKDIFIFLVTSEMVTDSEWISSFALAVSEILSDGHKLLIPLTVDQSLTESFFKSMNIAEWLPLESDPNEYYQDIDWMIERIKKFAQEQGLDRSSEPPPMDTVGEHIYGLGREPGILVCTSYVIN